MMRSTRTPRPDYGVDAPGLARGFVAGSFDAVVSHWLVHNLPTHDDRATVLHEMVRFLRPGGTLILADIHYQNDYVHVLRDRGLREVRIVEDGWYTRFCGLATWGGFVPSAVIARKDADGGSSAADAPLTSGATARESKISAQAVLRS